MDGIVPLSVDAPEGFAFHISNEVKDINAKSHHNCIVPVWLNCLQKTNDLQ